jgi:hypothetical protein
MSNEIHMNPVEHGKPTRSRLLYAVAGIMAGFAAYNLSQGHYYDMGDDIGTAFLLVLIDMQRRASWSNGFYTGANALADEVRDNND